MVHAMHDMMVSREKARRARHVGGAEVADLRAFASASGGRRAPGRAARRGSARP